MKTKIWFGLIVVCLLALSACGPAAPKPVKIVVSIPKDVDFGIQMGNAAQMAFDETGGKIGDVPVEMSLVDGGITENKGIATLNSVKDDPQVVVYLGAYTSGFARDL